VKRYDNPLSVVFLRLNKFHEFTDSHERIEEVRLLREVGRSLRSILREADYIGRYSDDEIGVALPETNRAGCEKALERIREKKQDLTDLLRAQWKDFDGRLHISFASFPKDAKGLEELVDVIDARYTEL